jgi:hypothetical protein
LKEDQNSWLTVGKTYHVLSVHIDKTGIVFRLVGDDGRTPALHRIENFEIVSNIIPLSWIVEFNPSGDLTLEPRLWRRAGFWEEYFAGKDDAVRAFASESAAAIANDP